MFRQFHNRAWRKIICLLIAQTFVFQPISWALAATQQFSAPAPSAWKQTLLKLPEKFGTIVEKNQGQGPIVICVQDLHCNAEVQNNISGIISFLSQKQALHWVGVEGSSEEVNVRKLATYPVKQVKERVGQRLLRQGKITGPEYCAAMSDAPLTLQGIEDKNQYQQSLDLVKKFLTDENQGYIYDLTEVLDAAKDKVFNPELLSWDKKQRGFYTGRTSLLAYATSLYQTAGRAQLDLNLYPQLQAYVSKRLNVFPVTVDSEALQTELNLVELQVRESLYQKPEERSLDGIGRQLRILERLLNISATAEELAFYRQHVQDFQIEKILGVLQQSSGEDISQEVLALNQAVQHAALFYQLAGLRSHLFVTNLLAGMARAKQSLGVVVMGGYHAPQVLAELKQRQISYICVKPKLTQIDIANPYFAIIRNQHTPLEKLLAQNQNILGPPSSFTNPVFANEADVNLKAEDALLTVETGAHDLATIQSQQVEHAAVYAENNPEIAIDFSTAEKSGTGFWLPFKNQLVILVIRIRQKLKIAKALETINSNSNLETALLDPSAAGQKTALLQAESTWWGALQGLRGQKLFMLLMSSVVKNDYLAQIRNGPIQDWMADAIQKMFKKAKHKAVEFEDYDEDRYKAAIARLYDFLDSAIAKPKFQENQVLKNKKPHELEIYILNPRVEKLPLVGLLLHFLGVFHFMGRIYITRSVLLKLDDKQMAAVLLHEVLEICGIKHDKAAEAVEEITGCAQEDLLKQAELLPRGFASANKKQTYTSRPDGVAFSQVQAQRAYLAWKIKESMAAPAVKYLREALAYLAYPRKTMIVFNDHQPPESDQQEVSWPRYHALRTYYATFANMYSTERSGAKLVVNISASLADHLRQLPELANAWLWGPLDQLKEGPGYEQQQTKIIRNFLAETSKPHQVPMDPLYKLLVKPYADWTQEDIIFCLKRDVHISPNYVNEVPGYRDLRRALVQNDYLPYVEEYVAKHQGCERLEPYQDNPEMLREYVEARLAQNGSDFKARVKGLLVGANAAWIEPRLRAKEYKLQGLGLNGKLRIETIDCSAYYEPGIEHLVDLAKSTNACLAFARDQSKIMEMSILAARLVMINGVAKAAQDQHVTYEQAMLDEDAKRLAAGLLPLAQVGQVELMASTPHIIFPLVLNQERALAEAGGHNQYQTDFQHPELAEFALATMQTKMREVFGAPFFTVWPGEDSVDEDTLKRMHAAGVRNVFVSEQFLGQTMAKNPLVPIDHQNGFYFVWDDDEGEKRIALYPKSVEDTVGFTMGDARQNPQWSVEQAADRLGYQYLLKEPGKDEPREHNVKYTYQAEGMGLPNTKDISYLIDGENAAEYFRTRGAEGGWLYFWNQLTKLLARTTQDSTKSGHFKDVEMALPAELDVRISRIEQTATGLMRARATAVGSGSWLLNYEQWAGLKQDQRKAWRLLETVLEAFAEADVDTAFREHPTLDPENHAAQAWNYLLQATTSCYWWWLSTRDGIAPAYDNTQRRLLAQAVESARLAGYDVQLPESIQVGEETVNLRQQTAEGSREIFPAIVQYKETTQQAVDVVILSKQELSAKKASHELPQQLPRPPTRQSQPVPASPNQEEQDILAKLEELKGIETTLSVAIGMPLSKWQDMAVGATKEKLESFGDVRALQYRQDLRDFLLTQAWYQGIEGWDELKVKDFIQKNGFDLAQEYFRNGNVDRDLRRAKLEEYYKHGLPAEVERALARCNELRAELNSAAERLANNLPATCVSPDRPEYLRDIKQSEAFDKVHLIKYQVAPGRIKEIVDQFSACFAELRIHEDGRDIQNWDSQYWSDGLEWKAHVLEERIRALMAEIRKKDFPALHLQPEQLRDFEEHFRDWLIMTLLYGYDHGFTFNHSWEVGKLGYEMAQTIRGRGGASKAPQVNPEMVLRAGWVHDAGKLMLPLVLLHKKGKLSDAEFAMLRSHAKMTRRILEAMGYQGEILDAAAHHEDWNGTGYPDGLKGEAIPEIARILRVADSFHAAANKRKYSTWQPPELILRELDQQSEEGLGKKYDPRWVKALKKVWSIWATPEQISEFEVPVESVRQHIEVSGAMAWVSRTGFGKLRVEYGFFGAILGNGFFLAVAAAIMYAQFAKHHRFLPRFGTIADLEEFCDAPADSNEIMFEQGKLIYADKAAMLCLPQFVRALFIFHEKAHAVADANEDLAYRLMYARVRAWFGIQETNEQVMTAIKKIEAAEIGSNESIRKRLTAMQKITMLWFKAVLFMLDTRTAGDPQARLPLDGLAVFFKAAFALLLVPILAWLVSSSTGVWDEARANRALVSLEPDEAAQIFSRLGAGNFLHPGRVRPVSELGPVSRLTKILGQVTLDAENRPTYYAPDILSTPGDFSPRAFFQELLLLAILNYHQHLLQMRFRLEVEVRPLDLALRLYHRVSRWLAPHLYVDTILAAHPSVLTQHWQANPLARQQLQAWAEQPESPEAGAWLDQTIVFIRHIPDQHSQAEALATLSALCSRLPVTVLPIAQRELSGGRREAIVLPIQLAGKGAAFGRVLDVINRNPELIPPARKNPWFRRAPQKASLQAA